MGDSLFNIFIFYILCPYQETYCVKYCSTVRKIFDLAGNSYLRLTVAIKDIFPST